MSIGIPFVYRFIFPLSYGLAAVRLLCFSGILLLSAGLSFGGGYWEKTEQLETGDFPRSLVFFSGGKTLAVAYNSYEYSHFVDLISIYDIVQVFRLPVLAGVHNSLALDQTGSNLFIPNESGGSFSRFQLQSGRVRHRISGEKTIQVQGVGDGRQLFVLTEVSDGHFCLHILVAEAFEADASRGVTLERIPAGLRPNAMVLEPGGERLFIVSTCKPPSLPTAVPVAHQPRSADVLSVLTVNLEAKAVTGTAEFSLKRMFNRQKRPLTTRTIVPGGLAAGYLPSGALRLFFAHPAYGVAGVDAGANTVAWVRNSPNCLTGLAYAVGTGQLLCTSRNADALLVLDSETGRVDQRIAPVSEDPVAVAVNPEDGKVYVVGSYTDGISVVKPAVSAPRRQKDEAAVNPAEPADVALRGRILFSGEKDGCFFLCSLAPDGSDLRHHVKTLGRFSYTQFSPDGRWLAFCRRVSIGNDLFCLDTVNKTVNRLTFRGGGTHETEVSVDGYAWHPDRNRIVFSASRKHDDSVIYSIRADGTGEMKLYDDFGDHNDCPRLHAADPDILLYSYEPGNWAYDRELRLFNRMTGEKRTLIPGDGKGVENISFLQDGRLFVGRSASGYRTVKTANIFDPSSGGLREIARGRQLQEAFTDADPDLRQVIVRSAEPRQLELLDLNSGQRRMLAPLDFEDVSAPCWAKMTDGFLNAPVLDLDPLLEKSL